ncbi:LacI family DNA-binding transcriptional regulator [Petroclostridium sp. X23]|uniref:LacI family DNA-binding transcriptional regulator n=1 Tax=Petroclostridium sp. X23 TaxID=3045146 RepID=UPI0024ACD0AF|nr:LacI family DNA-binding transcriptional regulator [Petroclostridium sp. X23]WHH58052.1 LacI family DNA-binding transcriptional regulator [Petroclostridium sp. X23]
MATIRDIAKKANVAVSTVSYVLNNRKKVKPETKERIMQVIEELNYQPRSVARSLKTKKTLTIGIMLPDICNLFFTETTRGIEDVANKYGYNVILCNTDKDSKKEKEYLNTLYSKDIDGIIFIGTCRNHHIIKNKQDTPIVFINSKVGDNICSVLVDDIKGGYTATKYLLERRKSEVTLLTGPLSRSSFFERMTGYLNALKSEGIEYNELLVHQCDVSFQGGYDIIRTIYDEGSGIKSIFAASDVIALGAVRALIEKGVRVPEDVSVVGYDDISIAGMFIPSLTTIHQPKYWMGEKAAELLIKRIEDRSLKSEHIVLEPKLIVREST